MQKIVFLLLPIFLAGCNLLGGQNGQNRTSNTQKTADTTAKQESIKFENPKKSAHYESNTPAHGSVMAGVPINVVINFNFDLAKPSSISINKDGKDYGVGETTIDTNKLTLRHNMDQSAPDGIYTVNYKACWPDGSCHEGHFQFAIDKTQASNFIDMTNKSQVTISLKNIMFDPKNIKISKGTKVTWTNSDSVSHYVNTDSHPAHTYILDMNSKELKQGDSYSYTFDKAGIYPYHCSAHADMMTANILVE